jgi:transposase-like protein
MNTPQESIHRSRRTREAVQRLVSEFQTSGLRPTEFCRRHGLAPSTLHRNLRKQGEAHSQAGAGIRFVTVKLNGAPGPAKKEAAPAGLEVVLAGGRRIGVGPGFDEATLGRLVRALEEL